MEFAGSEHDVTVESAWVVVLHRSSGNSPAAVALKTRLYMHQLVSYAGGAEEGEEAGVCGAATYAW